MQPVSPESNLMTNQNAIFQVAIGQTFREKYQDCLESVRSYADRIGAHYVRACAATLRVTPKQGLRDDRMLKKLGYLPIYEKLMGIELLKTYSNVAIIDGDVFVKPDAPCIFDHQPTGTPFCGVIEQTLPLCPAERIRIREYSLAQYIPLVSSHWTRSEMDGIHFYNMGVMLLNSSLLAGIEWTNPRQFISRPNFEPFVEGIGEWKHSSDQTLLNYWIRRQSVKHARLDWRWNALVGAIPQHRLAEAYFLHFFYSKADPSTFHKRLGYAMGDQLGA
ncbi:MAG: hypothetical protein Aurels2KO_48110 [Aureliella sp.]